MQNETIRQFESSLSQPAMDHIWCFVRKGHIVNAVFTLDQEEGHWATTEQLAAFVGRCQDEWKTIRDKLQNIVGKLTEEELFFLERHIQFINDV